VIESKPWEWSKNEDAHWRVVSGEFLPVGLRWKEEGRRRALDLGCGVGRHALFLARQGFEVCAFDLGEDGLAELRRSAEAEGLRIDVRCGDMLELPYDDASFDCLIAFHAIYHTDLTGLRRVLAEIRRVLAPGGEAFLTLNSRESDAYQDPSAKRLDDYTLLKTEGPEVDVPHTYVTHEDLPDLLAAFEILGVQQIIDYRERRRYAHFFLQVRRA
jgi:SAM-dependent methyltransferase